MASLECGTWLAKGLYTSERIVMSRRIAGYPSPLVLCTLVSFVLGGTTCIAGDLPSASGDTPYSQVSDEKPVKAESGQQDKAVSPAGKVRLLKPGVKADKGKSSKVSISGSKASPKLASDATTAEAAETAVGEPLAPGMVEILQQEIVNSVRERGITDNFARFQRYTGYKLDTSAAAYTGSELAGNCRLSWYDHMLRHPLSAVAEAEEFTRDVHTAILQDHGGLARLLPIIAEKLDLPKREAHKRIVAKTPQEALDIVKQALVEARAAQAAALAPLTKSEIRDLAVNVYPVMVGQNNTAAHTLNDRAPVGDWWT